MALTKPGGHFRTTDENTVDLVRRLAVHYDDTTIALILGRQRRRTGTGLLFTKSRVKTLRVSRGIPAFQPPLETVTPGSEDAVVVTVADAERLLGVGKVTIYRWLRDGFLTGEQLTPNAPWRIRIDQAVRDRIVPDVPDGWVGLDQAAAILGWPARPCCTRSNAATSPRSTSTADAEKACVSRSDPTSLDCSTHPDERKAQC